MECSMPGFPVLHYLLKFAQTWVGDTIHFILCHPLFLLPSIFTSIRVFSSELALGIRWPKYWSFNFSISPSNEYSGLISFRIDWFDLLAVQGTHKSLLQHHNSKASILWHSAFFMVQFSQLCLLENHSFDYMKLLPKWCLCFSKALSRFVIAFLPRSKVSFNFMATVTICSDFGAHENKI